MLAGYSKISLQDKLGIKPDHKVYFHNAPENLPELLGELPQSTIVEKGLTADYDFIHFFTRSHDELQAQFPVFKAALKMNGMLWISWPKKASKVVTDLNENIVRDIGLNGGMVDIKVCAVDEIWSGLKFVVPVKDRA